MGFMSKLKITASWLLMPEIVFKLDIKKGFDIKTKSRIFPDPGRVILLTIFWSQNWLIISISLLYLPEVRGPRVWEFVLHTLHPSLYQVG